LHLIRPFTGLRPVPERAADVAAPPYDVLSTDEARVRAEGRPWSFLHISKPEIDLPAGTDPYSPAVYAKGAENLNRMRAAGVLVRDREPCYYVYRLIAANHSQTGSPTTTLTAFAGTSLRGPTRRTTGCARSKHSTHRPDRC